MKSFTLTLLFCGLIACACAQKDSIHAQFVKSKCKRITIPLLPLAKKNADPPYFTNFEVIDFRADTSRLGFWAEGGTRRELVFRKNTSQELANYLNKVYSDPSAKQSFLIIIKNLWLFDEKKVNGQGHALGPETGNVIIRLEAFLKTREGLVPYTYVDTTITTRVSVVRAASSRLGYALHMLVEKIARLDESSIIQSRKVFSFAQLDSMNHKRFMYPMDTASILNAGVYATLEDFRNNRPSLLNYEIMPDKNGLQQVYLKDEKGQSYFSHTIFGYCDGNQIYAMMDGNLFPVFSIQHAYYVYGSREYKQKNTQVPYFIPMAPLGLYGLEPVAQTAVRQLRFFTLDVNSGEIY